MFDKIKVSPILLKALKAIAVAIVLLLPYLEPIAVLPAVFFSAWLFGRSLSKTSCPSWLCTCARVFTPLALLAIYLLFALYGREYFNEAMVWAWRWSPAFMFIIFAASISGLLATAAARAGNANRSRLPGHTAAWVVCLGLAGWSIFANWNNDVIEWEMSNYLNPELIDHLPSTDIDSMRLLPQQVASGYATSLNTEGRFDVGVPHIAPCDEKGKTCWQTPIMLGGREQGIVYNLLGETVLSVAMVDATTGVKNAWKLDEMFLAGPNSWPVKTAMAIQHPFSEPRGAFWVQEPDGNVVCLIPYVSRRPTWLGTMVPYLAGVAKLNRFGVLTDMSVSTAASDYPNVPFFPVDLAREYARIYGKWHGGIEGRTLTKLNELQISDAPAPDLDTHFNPAPYIQRYHAIGYQEVVAMEPTGTRSGALVELLFFDASTGYTRVYKTDAPQGAELRSPGKSIDVSRQSDADAGLYNVERVEPRFLFHDEKVYYIVGIVDKEHSGANGGHAYVRSVIIDARSNLSERFFSLDDLKGIMNKLDKGGALTPGIGTTPHAGTDALPQKS